MKQAILTDLKILRIEDENPDLSYLDQYKKKDNKKYYELDRERKRQYGNTWYMLGIKAIATILIPTNSIPTSYKIQEIESAGLWGIESDSGESYLTEQGLEQAYQLKEHLEILNVNMEGGIKLYANSAKTSKSFDELLSISKMVASY